MTVLLGQANYAYDGNPYLWGCDITTSETQPDSPYPWSCDIATSEAHQVSPLPLELRYQYQRAHQGSPVSNPTLTNTCAPHVTHTSNHAPRGTSYSKHVLLAYPGSRPLPDGLEKHCLGRQLSAHHNMPGKSSNH